jgi:serine/threonine-protein kinase
LYALGVTLYELLAGERPFPGNSLADLLAAHVRGVPTPIVQYRTDVPPSFRMFLERMIAREPARRFQSAEAALEALEFEADTGELTPGIQRSLRRDESRKRERILMVLLAISTIIATVLLAI